MRHQLLRQRHYVDDDVVSNRKDQSDDSTGGGIQNDQTQYQQKKPQQDLINQQQEQNPTNQQQPTKPKCKERPISNINQATTNQNTLFNRFSNNNKNRQYNSIGNKPKVFSTQRSIYTTKSSSQSNEKQTSTKSYQPYPYPYSFGLDYEDDQDDSDLPYCDQLEKGINIPWVPILCVLFVILVIAFIVWLINTIKKRIQTTKQYNQTPENFIQKPTLTLNQSKNLKLHSVKPFNKYTNKDLIIENKNQFGGNIYEVKFMNSESKEFSAAYWSKVLKTDCYFQLEIQTLNSQVEFGFVNRKYFGLLDSGVEMKLARVGVTLNTQGNLQLLGETKYQYRWSLQYGDVIGLGLTELDKTKRIWVTKNGILMNPPTSDQIEKWLAKESLSQQHREAYFSLNQENKTKNMNKKQDNQLIKKRLILPANQDFEYYAVVSSLQMKSPPVKKNNKLLSKQNASQNNKQQLVTTVRFNVGGKTFRLRDHNLRSGLLADSIEKNQLCNWLPCF